MCGPLPKMVKVKGDKFSGTGEKVNKWQIFRDGGSTLKENEKIYTYIDMDISMERMKK